MAARALSGGVEMQRKLAEMALRLNRVGAVRVGFLENATYPDGTPVAMIAAIQDFGAPSVGIPPRPFFRNMIAAKSHEWPAALEALLLSEQYDTEKVLDIVGEAIAGQLRESIINTNEPPLKPATIKAKGSSKPLVDTGVMLASVDHEVIR